MKHYLPVFIILISLSTHAEPFVEVALSARQIIGKQGTGYSHIDGTNIDIQTFRPYDVNVTKNPYASIAVGYNWKLKPSIELGIAIRHESSLVTSRDRGISDFRIMFRWDKK